MTTDTKAVHELSNGIVINAENPEMHDGPQFCRNCKIFYYFGPHYCPEQVDFPVQPHTAMKRGMKGYYDGEKEEKVKKYFEQQK